MRKSWQSIGLQLPANGYGGSAGQRGSKLSGGRALESSMLNVLVPPPQPDVPVMVVGTQQSAVTCNPLSVLSRNIPNCVPSLEDEMVEIVHKHPKKQHLANSDFANLYWPLLAVLRTKQQLKPRQQRTAKEMHS